RTQRIPPLVTKRRQRARTLGVVPFRGGDAVLQSAHLESKIGAVSHDLAVGGYRTVRLPHRLEHATAPETAAVSPNVPTVVVGTIGRGGDGHFLPVYAHFAVLRRKEDAEVHPERFLSAVAELQLGAAEPLHDGTRRIQYDKGVRRGRARQVSAPVAYGDAWTSSHSAKRVPPLRRRGLVDLGLGGLQDRDEGVGLGNQYSSELPGVIGGPALGLDETRQVHVGLVAL